MGSTGTIQLQQKTIDLLKKGTLEIARKDAEFLQKRINALQNEMSIMTRMLAATPADRQGPILSGLQELGNRLKSTGRAVSNFGSGANFGRNSNLLGKNIDTTELSKLQASLTSNYLSLASNYTSLGGGPKSAALPPSALQKLIDQVV